jgi:BASS family bile acid:Na+ symporter
MALLKSLVMLLVLVFMIGSLFGLGLELAARDAIRALRNVRFVLVTILGGWVLGPLVALLLVALVPMERPYAVGLLLLSLAPCAPFVPMMAERARGDRSYTGAVMLIGAVGTVLVMPWAVPLLVPELTADAWMIGKPLVLYILLPLLAGMLLKSRAPGLAASLGPPIKRVTTVVTLVMLAGLGVVYARNLAGAVGSMAIGAQTVFVVLVMVGGYGLAAGLREDQRRVLVLAMGTRNIGAGLAPLVSVPGIDPRAIVMCVLAMVATVILSALAARWFAGRPY